jgi:hypothetical protein
MGIGRTGGVRDGRELCGGWERRAGRRWGGWRLRRGGEDGWLVGVGLLLGDRVMPGAVGE